jgi:hypothetical protein
LIPSYPDDLPSFQRTAKREAEQRNRIMEIIQMHYHGVARKYLEALLSHLRHDFLHHGGLHLLSDLLKVLLLLCGGRLSGHCLYLAQWTTWSCVPPSHRGATLLNDFRPTFYFRFVERAIH